VEIGVRTDRHVSAGDDLVSFVGFEMVAGLGPCADRVLSACVHLTTDWSTHDGRPVLRCLLEVRPAGHAPLAVIHRAAEQEDAVRAAIADVRGLLERMFRRIDARCPEEGARRVATVHQPV
jgi:hypothetical protein